MQIIIIVDFVCTSIINIDVSWIDIILNDTLQLLEFLSNEIVHIL